MLQPVGRLSTRSADHGEPDVARLTEVLDRHGVDYLVCRTTQNFERLAEAMRELHARLRVEGLTDDEAAQLPTQLHGEAIARMEISTWQTDAGSMDVLVDMPDRQGHHLRYEDLAGGAERLELAGTQIRVAGLGDIIASKEWANRPKDHRALPEPLFFRRIDVARR